MTATPRKLDPKYIEPTQVGEPEPMIVHKQYVMVGNVQHEKMHGPMPVSEWAAYEKENGL